jgi:glycosyltransferase involved in cell wall biosynthesis
MHTNRFENMPVSIIEMWACGLPIVATDVGGMPYLVRSGLDAILVPSEDHRAMAAACIDLLSRPQLASTLSVNGRARAEGLTWGHAAPMWERVLFGDAAIPTGLSSSPPELRLKTHRSRAQR